MKQLGPGSRMFRPLDRKWFTVVDAGKWSEVKASNGETAKITHLGDDLWIGATAGIFQLHRTDTMDLTKEK